MDTLVDNITKLCTLNKKFHGKKRENELKSLTKYLKDFKDFSYDEFVRFVCNQYIHSLKHCKRFCSQSIYNRVSAIQSRLDINVLSRRRYNSILKNLRKLFNPYNRDTKFYSNTGVLIEIPPEEFQMLRENAKKLIEQNHTNVADRWILNTYTDEEIETVYNYFKLNLENFLRTERKPYTVVVGGFDNTFIELCMLIVFCYNTPRRISEIMNLTVEQVEQLILHNTLNIKSKDGFSIDCIYISVSLADLLNRFVLKMHPNIFETTTTTNRNMKIFTSTYKMYYSRMRNTLKVLIGEDRLKNLRIFHGFRNYFANKHLTSNECQQILGHRNKSMTKKYAKGQNETKELMDKKKLNILDFLNKDEK